MRKSEAKKKYKAGDIQIHYDVENVELLREIIDKHSYDGLYKCYRYTDSIYSSGFSNIFFNDIPIVKLSEITEDEDLILGDVTTITGTPKHYDNSKGSLYKIAVDRGWNAYQLDAIKRIDRVEKKGEFLSDIDKTIEVLQLYKKEQGYRFPNEIEPLNK